MLSLLDSVTHFLRKKDTKSNSEVAIVKWPVCVSSTFHQYILNKEQLSYITFCLTLLQSQVMILHDNSSGHISPPKLQDNTT
jgi:hypothetical protein